MSIEMYRDVMDRIRSRNRDLIINLTTVRADGSRSMRAIWRRRARSGPASASARRSQEITRR
jgi:uncharacterized protein (DUF849 family)